MDRDHGKAGPRHSLSLDARRNLSGVLLAGSLFFLLIGRLDYAGAPLIFCLALLGHLEASIESILRAIQGKTDWGENEWGERP